MTTSKFFRRNPSLCPLASPAWPAALLLCFTSAVGAGSPKVDKTWDFAGIWTTHTNSQSGAVDTRCDFRKDRSFRCDTQIGTVTSYYGTGHYNAVSTSSHQFLLNYEMGASSPASAGKRFTAMYEIVEPDMIRAMDDGAISRRELPGPGRARHSEKKKRISLPPADSAHGT